MSTMKQSTVSLFLLATAGVFQVNAQIDDPNFRICGLNYTSVIDNCNTNPKCPTGDNCPVGYTCFQLNDQLCPPDSSAPTTTPTSTPTSAPTPVPTPVPAFKVCATGFFEATSSCFDTTKSCATCNNVTEACFTIAPDQCTDAPTALQTATPTAAPKPTPSPTVSAAPTKAPTPNKYFCATSWETVDADCSTATPCPNGQRDCVAVEMNCYEIQADKCASPTSPVDTGSSETEGSDTTPTSPADTGSSETEGSGAQLNDSPPATVSGKVRVCAKDMVEATFNCNTNTPCPDGAAAQCASGEACFELDSCGTSSGTTVDPTEASTFSFATAAPFPSPSGGDQTPESSPTASNISSQSPTPLVGFAWTTPPPFTWNPPAPSGSSIPHINFVLKSVLVGASALGAALAMF
mmetsp:Transcript_8539/g.17233  ORF Transcript_8539/g.17233 Transcript_8539/m.17233 type:complete len:407 (-) Transcript_8539:71-1291(-)